ncbi:serine hydrolase [Cryptosporangium arvum]|uniref:Beta-lactamase n=1 Tax=Cryptosporangium arvum DSM 44712 TaxID=927661 RepID=A0A011AIP2_9ACTN|nr:serine hydrolase [Cryptosporangium arvum]EXG81886.1 Beta-lactamase [Cryptosporangium arvum DSM 44712]
MTLWEQVPTTFVAVHGWDRSRLESDLARYQADGLRPDQLGPYSVDSPSVARFTPIRRRRDAGVVVPALVADFARGHGLPAVSLAVVREDLLRACGVGGMLTARDAPPNGDIIRCYPSPGDEDPYRIRIDRMDAHGGWMATAVDLLRFAVRVDGSGSDVQAPASTAFMTTPSGLAGSSGYGAGWTTSGEGAIDPGVGSHTGVLPGATGLLQRSPDGLTCAVLTNTNVRHEVTDTSTDTVPGLFRLLARIRGQVDHW